MRLILTTLVLLALPGLAAAQCPAPTPTTGTLVSNPTSVEFQASADHNTVLLTTPVLTSYAVEVCDGTTLVRTTNIGKPTPSATNIISTALSSASLPKNRVLYTVVAAIGPAGTTRSAPSNPFAWPDVPAAAGVPLVKP